MRSAPCAWAPSHPLHAMPPRITRNSHRPRASDRTMVDLEHQFGLPLFRTRWHRHHPRRKLMSMGNRPSFSRQAQLQWAGSRETNLASGRGRTFFLTSLFIELIDWFLSVRHSLSGPGDPQSQRDSIENSRGPPDCHEIVMVARSERIVSKQNGSNRLICNPLKRGVQ